MNDIPENPTSEYMLATYQEQLDPEGINVGVSRQALDETLEKLKDLQEQLEQKDKEIERFQDRAAIDLDRFLEVSARNEKLERVVNKAEVLVRDNIHGGLHLKKCLLNLNKAINQLNEDQRIKESDDG